MLAITFDDAFASVKALAWPILRNHGAVATVFAPTAFMDDHTDLEWAGIDHWKNTVDSDELRAMDWDDLGELAQDGWEIGSHTCTHPRLTRLDDDALAHELSASRAICAERLGRPCRSIAYPYGDMNPRVVAAAAAAGYETGARLSRDLRPVGPLVIPAGRPLPPRRLVALPRQDGRSGPAPTSIDTHMTDVIESLQAAPIDADRSHDRADGRSDLPRRVGHAGVRGPPLAGR